MTPEELRTRILATVRTNGGHLASSLGAVEIAWALARVFDPAKDRIVWDVGHQAYAWKLLTGRADRFETLRRFGGLSGFPNPNESPADAAFAGHAGVALSVAEGMAAAEEQLHGTRHIVAVVGDGALGNGTALEALNACAAACRKVILVVNDNRRSGAHPVLNRAFFETFGLHCAGPVDGHDTAALEAAFAAAKAAVHSVAVHVVTVKGRGYAPAEADPAFYHGIAPADAPAAGRTWSACFGEILTRLARTDARIFALTAGMRDGTGLAPFAAAHPDRFRDTGIAEGHAVAYAAGLAARGLRPVVAVYSTFLQRAVDQVMQDVCLARLPVVFCVDRAGVVGADGVTHQGLYDFAMLKCLPNLTICQPTDATDLERLLGAALTRNGPTVIRYPRGAAPETAAVSPVCDRPAFAVWATADWYGKACAVAARLGGVAVAARFLKPLDTALLTAQRAAGLRIVSLENCALAGGLGESLGADIRFGWPDEFIPHGTPDELERAYGLDVESVTRRLQDAFSS